MQQTFLLIAVVAVVLAGCGKKPPAKYTLADFNHPSDELLRDIAQKQGWQIEDVRAKQRVADALEANQKPTEADWQILVKAADTEKNNFDLELAMLFSRHMTDEYREPVLKWCERNMAQTNDPYAAVLAYDCYARSGGDEKDSWADQLKARGQFYMEKIAEADQRAAKRAEKLKVAK
jgi:hypothetical protein